MDRAQEDNGSPSHVTGRGGNDMELLDHDLYLFTVAQTEADAVVNRRPDVGSGVCGRGSVLDRCYNGQDGLITAAEN
jgi:hypothetical protein